MRKKGGVSRFWSFSRVRPGGQEYILLMNKLDSNNKYKTLILILFVLIGINIAGTIGVYISLRNKKGN